VRASLAPYQTRPTARPIIQPQAGAHPPSCGQSPWLSVTSRCLGPHAEHPPGQGQAIALGFVAESQGALVKSHLLEASSPRYPPARLSGAVLQQARLRRSDCVFFPREPQRDRPHRSGHGGLRPGRPLGYRCSVKTAARNGPSCLEAHRQGGDAHGLAMLSSSRGSPRRGQWADRARVMHSSSSLGTCSRVRDPRVLGAGGAG